MNKHEMAVALRKCILKCFSPRIQHLIKKAYYPRWIKRYDEANWLCSAAVKELIQPGDHVLDIGANIGYVSHLLSKWVGPNGHVHSFEPVPDTFDLLASNMRRLGAANVTVHHCALSDCNNAGRIVVPKSETGAPDYYRAHLIEDGNSNDCSSQAEIPVCTLDSFDAEIQHPIRFIKIDVEGHELAVIKGGRKIIESSRPVLMIEVGEDPDQPDSNACRLFQTLRSMGYAAHIDEGSKLRPRNPGEQTNDYFFVAE